MAMGPVILLIFIILFVLFLSQTFSSAQDRSDSEREVRRTAPARTRRRARSSSVPRPSLTARRAMQGAHYLVGENYVSIADIGLLTYRQSNEPRLVRDADVWTDTEYVRPFVELWLPHQARGKVRFELLDGEQRLRYADEARYDLARGSNTLLPQTWLPLRGRVEQGERWQLRVLAGDTLLGSHGFGWQAVGGGELRNYMAADGEISPVLMQALDDERQRGMSLSDLLAGQDD